ncbi:MAG: dihydropteroate synthase [Pseudomonadota bacterium]
MSYWRPLIGEPALGGARLAGGWCHFTHVERIRRNGDRAVVPISDVPKHVMDRLTSPRDVLAGMAMNAPRIMGILNVTPDSFSDGGLFDKPDAALAQARAMAEVSDILDIGGESTRPGAEPVGLDEEIARTAPVIKAIRAEMDVPISIDTRNAPVAEAALEAGADLVNDVSGFLYDGMMARVTAEAGAPCCLMHSIETPVTMQDDPVYEDVVLDVYDHLAECVAAAVRQGIPRSKICIDPGIGFGKTLDHNLALLRNLSIFHGIGCPILLGASRKRFIGTIADEPDARGRMPGSVAVALHGVRQGVQILRVHDTDETRQALSLHMAVTPGM